MKVVAPRLFLSLTFAVLLAACTGSVQEVRRPLRVAWSEWPGDYPLILAAQLDLYEKYGVEVELINEAVYGNSIANFAARSIDAFNCTLGDALLLSGKTDLKVVLVADSSEGADVVLATEIINSPGDLKGKRFGMDIGSVKSELFLQQMLQGYGLAIGDISLVDMRPEDVPGALGYRIDAGHTWATYARRAEVLGYQAIFSSAQAAAIFPDVVIFHTELLNQRPDDIRAFLAAVLEAVVYWRDNPEAGNQLIADFTGLPEEEVIPQGITIYTLEDNLVAFRPGEAVFRPGEVPSLFSVAQFNLEYMVRSGSATRAPDIEQLFDSSFLR